MLTYIEYINSSKRIDYTTSYLYDAASSLVSITYPDGTIIEQEYDNLNRITAVNQYAQFLWNGNSQPEQITYHNGVTTEYVYDLRNRPLKIRTAKNDSDLLHLTYSYDCAGNILQMKNSEENGIQITKEQWDYTYDNLNRLLTAVGDPGDGYSLQYEYDSTGNRIEMNNTLYTYNNMNKLLSIDSELSSPGNTPWWDSSYTFRREITFGENHDLIPEGYTCTFTMDTTEYLQTGDDIRIVYQTDTQAVELDRIGDTWNTPTTKITFKTQSEIPANTERGTGTYYVYYGNPQAYPPPADPSRIYLFYDDFNRANSLVVGNSWIEDEQNLGIGILRISENQLRIEEHENEYAHAEQVITGNNIEISCRIKPDAHAGYGWAPSLDVFWNDNNNGNHIQILTFGNGKLGCKVVSNGTADSQFLDGVVTINQYNWVRIRLTPSTIYFDYGGTGTTPVWVNNLNF